MFDNWLSQYSWFYTVHKLWREKNQQDATIICLLLTSISTCFGHHYAHHLENKGPRYCIWCIVLVQLDVVGSGSGALRCRMRALWRFLFDSETHKPSQCSHPTTQRPTTATNHIQLNQSNTPNAVTRSLFSWRWAWWCPKHVETEVNNKHLNAASCWFFFSLHTQPVPVFLCTCAEPRSVRWRTKAVLKLHVTISIQIRNCSNKTVLFF